MATDHHMVELSAESSKAWACGRGQVDSLALLRRARLVNLNECIAIEVETRTGKQVHAAVLAACGEPVIFGPIGRKAGPYLPCAAFSLGLMTYITWKFRDLRNLIGSMSSG